MKTTQTAYDLFTAAMRLRSRMDDVRLTIRERDALHTQLHLLESSTVAWRAIFEGFIRNNDLYATTMPGWSLFKQRTFPLRIRVPDKYTEMFLDVRRGQKMIVSGTLTKIPPEFFEKHIEMHADTITLL